MSLLKYIQAIYIYIYRVWSPHAWRSYFSLAVRF